jgi:hypothetical protein
MLLHILIYYVYKGGGFASVGNIKRLRFWSLVGFLALVLTACGQDRFQARDASMNHHS